MIYRFFLWRGLCVLFAFLLWILPLGQSADADGISRYVRYNLQASEPVSMVLDEAGNTREFSPQSLERGQQLFDESCLFCHLRGANVPFPSVSLSLEDLAGATPPRDNIAGFVAYMREPMTYDGSDYTPWCRQVPESWMSSEQIEDLAAFVIRAAQKDETWGVRTVEVNL
ncbi:MAG: photosystem II cytochrome PsbV2 [Geitlerinemataceae cyanobacterium]